jgi:hypothetical protein
MKRLALMFLGFALLWGHGPEARAESQKAKELRQTNGLTAFTPAGKFLESNFVAEEMTPNVIFGTVKSFAASRKCPTAWLIEADQKDRLPSKGGKDEEFTVYLEEDCPNQVVYYVFIDQSNLTPKQWIEWREKFARSKAEPQYGDTKSKLDQACTEGCGVGAELRFIQKNGELQGKTPEAVLLQELKIAPIYDLNKRMKLSK